MRIVLTCGDCNGIGPEIIIRTINHFSGTEHKFTVIMPGNVFKQAYAQFSGLFKYADYNQSENTSVVRYSLPDIPLQPGSVTAEAGNAAGKAVEAAVAMLQQGRADVMVTAPLHKEAFHKGGYNYPGHTEFISALCGTIPGKMMFIGNEFNAGLVTIHLPLSKVASAITSELLRETILSFKATLQKDFAISTPRIAVLGLNPHAGEGGEIGDEEEKIFKPVLQQFQGSAFGPFPADAYFARRLFSKYDITLGMYHDQILAPFKLLHKGRGVNYTSGLTIIRTSPDHGTAFDIAGKGIADEGSMIEAVYAALHLAERRYAQK